MHVVLNMGKLRDLVNGFQGHKKRGADGRSRRNPYSRPLRKDQLRILTIESISPDGQIEANLIVDTPANLRQSYVACSYVWRSNEKSHSIQLAGATIPVTASAMKQSLQFIDGSGKILDTSKIDISHILGAYGSTKSASISRTTLRRFIRLQ